VTGSVSGLWHDDQAFFDKHNGTHPVTGMRLEDGYGALPISRQALLHCAWIEQSQGKEAADAIRAQLKELK
jgi:hypothetical protein